jgi:hypothetical protein
MDWTNVAISGSLIPACVAKYNPLLELFDNNFLRYLNEYYCDSDIDLMININDKFKFYEKVYSIFKVIQYNISQINNTCLELVKLEPENKCAFFINRNFINDYLVPKLNMSVDEILKDLNTDDIKQIIYPKYIIYKMEENKKYDNEIKLKYPIYFNSVSINNLNIYFYKTKKEIQEQIEQNKKKIVEELNQELNDNDEDTFEDDENNKTNEYKNKQELNDEDENFDFIVKESVKFKIISKLLFHNIEIFQTKYDTFFSTVSKFHLPCVRGYYNGKDTLLLPSCVSANLTFINIDYKYFAGAKDPIEIINKYRIRGYGTFLNDKEKIKFIEYNDSVSKWKKLYNLNKKNKASVDSILGAIDINNDFFKPRKIVSDLYQNNRPVLYDYKKLNYEILKDFTSDINNDLFNEYKSLFGISDIELSIYRQIYTSANYLKRDGYVKPLDKWWLDYFHNLLYRLNITNN